MGNNGRVLVYDYNTYNTTSVCADDWDDIDATIVCKQTGQGDTGRAMHLERDYNFTSKFGHVNCMGHESEIHDCQFSDNYGVCHYFDAAAECSYSTTSGSGKN